MTVPADLQPTPPGLHRAAETERLAFPDGSTLDLLADLDASAAGVTFHHTTLRPGAVGAAPHHHRTAPEHFFVQRGTVRFLLGDDLVEVNAGDLVTVDVGVVHAFAAADGDDEAELLVITPQVGRFDLFRRYARLAAGDATAQPVHAEESQSRFDTYVTVSPTWERSRLEPTQPQHPTESMR
jgi:mannose-6-phosphate isomerase-like protein (cupin superfamily)